MLSCITYQEVNFVERYQEVVRLKKVVIRFAMWMVLSSGNQIYFIF